MINDDYEYGIAVSMDDLENLDYYSLQTSAKFIKLQKPSLTQNDENASYVSGGKGTGSTSNILMETFRISAETLSLKLWKTALINSGIGSGGEMSSNRNTINNLNRS